jgi:hypothetical protein
VSDRRYSTARWQRLRRAVLRRDGYQCMIGGPRCRGHANTVHHRVPSSEAPELFWSVRNLEAACSTCNYGGGAGIAAGNRRAASARIAELEQRNWHLEQAVEELEGDARSSVSRSRLRRATPRANRPVNGRNRRSTSPIASSRLFRDEQGSSRRLPARRSPQRSSPRGSVMP